jgi:dipeptidase D
VKTTGSIAYKIKISGLEGGDSSDMTRKHGNPIKALGQMMNSMQSSGLAFQVNDFKGGTSSGTFPTFAEMIVTVDKNDENKLLSKFDNMQKDFEDSYRDNENSLSITCTKCKAPATSYSETDTADIMSFLYTVKDGTFATTEEDNEGDAVAVSNIGYASEKGKDHFVLGIKGRSIEPNIFKDMLQAYSDTAELSDFKIKETGAYPRWPYKDRSELTDSFSIAAQQADIDLEPIWTFEENECALFYEKRQELDMICVGTNIQSGQEIAQSLVMYLQSLGGE